MKALSSCLLLLFAGCSAGTPTEAEPCAGFAGRYPIEYVGGALGTGELALSPREDPDVLDAHLTLRDETGTQAVLEVFGPARCARDLVYLSFGGGDHPEARVRVLGGTGTLVPANGRVETLFGAWDVTVFVKADGTTRKLSGFLRHREAESPEAG